MTKKSGRLKKKKSEGEPAPREGPAACQEGDSKNEDGFTDLRPCTKGKK